jgi:integrase
MSKSKNLIWRNGWASFVTTVAGKQHWIALGTQDKETAETAAAELRRKIQAERLRARLEAGNIRTAIPSDPDLAKKLGLMRQRTDLATIGELEVAWTLDAGGRNLKERSWKNYWSSLHLILRTVCGEEKDTTALRTSIITEELAHDYEAAVIRAHKERGPADRRSALVTAASTWNQARSIFAAPALKGAHVRALKLPDFAGFRSFTPQAGTTRVRTPVDDTTLERLARGADDLWFSAPARWLALALCGNLGLRRGSAKLARWDWVRRIQGQWRLYLLTTDETAPKGNEHFVTIDDSLWADMCEVRQGGDYIVPGNTIEERDLVFDANVTWLRGLGLDVDKPTHELRAIYAQAMKRQHGAQAAQDAMGHTDGRTTQGYTGRGSEKSVRPL